ncbi:hypothetical protein RUM44_003984 [Polyplax serrata]|uniref:Uncharacterized protein n=1 Tax=Polyplax serrata TaxID=468196 RepID=A0ABR1B1J8_POLSC
MIAPSAKKLWGVEEPRDDKGLLHLSDHQMWRDSTWSIADHAVSQPISMVPRRSGSFPGSDTANMLSPRSSDTGGLGVKMVEYVLATSPTNKDHLETRMRNLVLNSADGDKKEKELNENTSCPYETKKDDVNGNAGQTNGHASNGLSEEEKTFNRTPGSRQPSPAEEEINKNNAGAMTLQPAAIMAQKAAQMEHLHMMRHMNGLHPVLALQAHQQQQTLQNGNLLPGPPPVPPHDNINQHFEHSVHATLEQNFDPSNYASGIGNGTPTVLAGTSGGMDSPGVLPQNLDIQVGGMTTARNEILAYPFDTINVTDFLTHCGNGNAQELLAIKSCRSLDSNTWKTKNDLEK